MMKQNDSIRGEIVLYQAPDGTVELDVRLERESLWLSQKQMSLLFDKARTPLDCFCVTYLGKGS
jgi:hypothetical protein